MKRETVCEEGTWTGAATPQGNEAARGGREEKASRTKNFESTSKSTPGHRVHPQLALNHHLLAIIHHFFVIIPFNRFFFLNLDSKIYSHRHISLK